MKWVMKVISKLEFLLIKKLGHVQVGALVAGGKKDEKNL